MRRTSTTRFEIGRAELATLGEIAEIFSKARPPGEERIGQVEQLLEIAVPGGQTQLGVEHRDAVTHVVEGDAQLGLALADLGDQPRVLDRDDGLVGESTYQLDLP